MKLSKVKIILRDLIFDFNNKFSNLGKPFLEGWNILHKIKFMTKKLIQERRGQLKYEFSKISSAKILWEKIFYILGCLRYIKGTDFQILIGKNW